MPAQLSPSTMAAIDWLVKLLSAATIPVLLWVKELEIQRAVHEERLGALTKEVESLKKENETLKIEVHKSNAILPIILGVLQ